MQKIKFSVLIISFNQEKYIKEAIESVLNQSYQNFEIVVSDDCSIDKTQEVVKSFVDERIKLVKTPFNIGINGNEELGIKACSGDYIVLLGGDDRLRPQHLEKMYETITQKNADVVYVHLCPINEFGHYKHGKDYDFWNYQEKTKEEFLHDYFMSCNQVPSPGMTVKREAFEKILPLNLSLVPYQDYKEHVMLLLDDNKVVVVNELLVDYRQFGDERNISNNVNGKVAKRCSLESSLIMDSFMKIRDIELLRKIFKNEIKISKIEPKSNTIPFFLGYMAVLSKNEDKQAWGYKRIADFISTFDGFNLAYQNYGFSFKEFLDLVNNIEFKFNKKAKKYKKLFVLTLILSGLLILILLWIIMCLEINIL